MGFSTEHKRKEWTPLKFRLSFSRPHSPALVEAFFRIAQGKGTTFGRCNWCHVLNSLVSLYQSSRAAVPRAVRLWEEQCRESLVCPGCCSADFGCCKKFPCGKIPAAGETYFYFLTAVVSDTRLLGYSRLIDSLVQVNAVPFCQQHLLKSSRSIRQAYGTDADVESKVQEWVYVWIWTVNSRVYILCCLQTFLSSSFCVNELHSLPCSFFLASHDSNDSSRCFHPFPAIKKTRCCSSDIQYMLHGLYAKQQEL